MIGFPLGLLAANAMEWAVHKYVLHGPGKKKGTFWSFHFHEHHKHSRQNGFVDPAYKRSWGSWNAQSKELMGLVGSTALFAPLIPRAPYFFGALAYSAWNYYRVHKKSHLDPEWAKEHLPWHYDHHMGSDQDSNWCVTKPWFDYVMGTRKPYLGTEQERLDNERREKRARKKATTMPNAVMAAEAKAESQAEGTAGAH